MRYTKQRLIQLISVGLVLVLGTGTLAYLLALAAPCLAPRRDTDRGQREARRPASSAPVGSDKHPPHDLLLGLDPTAIPAAERFAWQPKELVAVLGHHRQRHWSGILQTAYSPDGKLLATGGTDGVRLWDTASLREVAFLRHNETGGGVFRFSPNGSLLAVGEGATATLWDVRVNPPRHLTEILPEDDEHSFVFFDFSGDSKILAVANLSRNVRLFDVASLQPRLLQTVVQPANAIPFALSPDGRLLAVWCEDDTLRLWDVSTATSRLVVTKRNERIRAVNKMLFTPDGKFLVLATGFDGTVPGFISPSRGDVLFWRVGSDKFSLEDGLLDDDDVGQGAAVVSLDLTRDGRVLACGDSQNHVHVWDIVGEKPKLRMVFRDCEAEDPKFGSAVALSPDGKSLAAAGRDNDYSLHIWDIGGATAKLRFWDRFQDDWFYAADLQFSPDSRTLASYRYKWSRGKEGQGSEICLWDLTGKRPCLHSIIPLVEKKNEGGGDSVANMERGVSFRFGPDRRFLTVVAASADNIIQLWDVTRSKPRCMDRLEACESAQIDKFVYSPQRKLAVTALNPETLPDSKPGDREYIIRLWDMTQPQPVKVAEATNEFSVESLVFSPRGDLLATADGGGFLRLWRVSDAKLKCVDVLQCETHLLKGNDPRFRNYRPSLVDRMWGMDKLDWEHHAVAPQIAACFGPDNRLWLVEVFWHRGVRRCRLRSWDISKSAGLSKDRPVIDTYLTIASEIKGPPSPLRMTVAPQGDLFLRINQSFSSMEPSTETFFLIDPHTGKTKYKWDTPGPINAASLSPDGRYLATANGNGTVYILQLPP